MTLEDEHGMVNLVVWPKTWAKHRRLARHSSLLGCDGELQRQGDAMSVLVHRFWSVPDPPQRSEHPPLAQLPVRARNFH